MNASWMMMPVGNFVAAAIGPLLDPAYRDAMQLWWVGGVVGRWEGGSSGCLYFQWGSQHRDLAALGARSRWTPQLNCYIVLFRASNQQIM